ncbi:MAG: RrF2 family transcriptional regulator [Halodesulfovibrio sp.]
MKLSARTRYAARLLLDLAQHGNSENPVTTTTLSEVSGISVQFIEQILKPLKKAGLVSSVRGAAGGHMLTRSPEEISIGDVIRIMEGGVELTHCCQDDIAKECPRTERCLTRVVWLRASRALEKELDSISLKDLIDGVVTLSE